MKKRLLAVFSAIMLVTVVTVLAAGGEAVTQLTEILEETKESIGLVPTTEEVPADILKISTTAVESGIENEMDIIMQRMVDNGAYYDEIKSTLEKYIDINFDYNLSDNEKIILLNLSYKDYDFEKLLDVYSFIKLTDLDETDLEAMYLLTEKSDTEESIENAYAIYTNRVDDELTVSDVAYYVAEGITIDEILYAYELTLTGDKRIKEVLDEYLSGKTPGEIIAESYGLEPDLFGDQANFTQVLTARTISRKTKNSIKNVVTFDNEGVLTINEEVIQGYTQNKIKALKKKSVLGKFNDLDVLIETDLCNISGISFEEAKQLAKNGYTVREIQQASKEEELCKNGEFMQITPVEQED